MEQFVKKMTNLPFKSRASACTKLNQQELLELIDLLKNIWLINHKQKLTSKELKNLRKDKKYIQRLLGDNKWCKKKTLKTLSKNSTFWKKSSHVCEMANKLKL